MVTVTMTPPRKKFCVFPTTTTVVFLAATTLVAAAVWYAPISFLSLHPALPTTVKDTGTKITEKNEDILTASTEPDQITTDQKISHKADKAAVIYPLRALNLFSAQEAYERGFWARAAPVPLDRWQAVANTTCMNPHIITTTTKAPNENDWKLRVPHAIMIGAQKAGTTALSYYLYNHPSVQYLPSKELAYFDEELDQNPTIIVNSSGIDGAKVWDYYRETVIGGLVPLKKLELEVKYVLDATPNYMLLSDRVPHRIFCATPWVKLLASLRNPVDRAFSQYHMQVHRQMTHPELRRGFVSFEDYIALDMKVLQDTGVLPQGYGGWENGDAASVVVLDAAYFASEQVLQGWATYTKLGLNSPVGRGLYILQLQEWFQTMDRYQKPRSDLKVFSSDRLLRFPNETYAEILEFLELKPHNLESFNTKIHATQYRVPSMDPEIRAKLHAFYEPFNRLLRDLLNDTEWDGIWQ